MIDQTKAPDAGGDSGLGKALHGNSSEAQRLRLLARLRRGPLTTIEARRDLDILMPAARVFELRERGFGIVTYRIEQSTDYGRTHSVALYALQSIGGIPTKHGAPSSDSEALPEAIRAALDEAA